MHPNESDVRTRGSREAKSRVMTARITAARRNGMLILTIIIRRIWLSTQQLSQIILNYDILNAYAAFIQELMLDKGKGETDNA